MIETTRAGIVCRPVFYLLFLIGVLLASSCYSSSYQKEMAANTDLIAGLADKLGDYCQAGFTIGDRQISSEEMGEFYYALKKARAFINTQKGEENRPSYRDFTVMLAQYASFVRASDEYRLGGHADEATLAILKAQRITIDTTASRVRTDLKSES
jgi:hypothetical protein